MKHIVKYHRETHVKHSEQLVKHHETLLRGQYRR